MAGALRRWSDHIFRLAAIGTVPVILTMSLPMAAFGQTPPGTVILGRVTGPENEPISGAVVTVTVTRQLAKTARTNSSGEYHVSFDSAGSTYLVTVAKFGFTPQRREVTRAAGEHIAIVVDLRMVPQAQALGAVRTVVQRPRPWREDRGAAAGPGATQATVDLASGLSGDLTGDLTAALGMLPGIALIPDAAGGPPTVSAFGLTGQNSQTLNGMDLGGGAAPRDGLVTTVHMSAYDPKFGKFAGVHVNSNLSSGNYLLARSLHVTLDDPNLEWTTRVPAQLGTRYQNLIVSGTSSGPIVRDKIFYSSAYQLGRQVSELATLSTADALSLHTLGINPDSVTRLDLIAGDIGLPLSVPGVPSSRITTNGSAIARLDLTPAASRPGSTGDALYLLVAGNFTNRDGLGTGPTALPARASQLTQRSGQLLIDYSPYLWSALSETKTSLSSQETSSDPYVALPGATLLLSSTFPDGSGGVVPLQIGGNSGARSSQRNWRWQTTNETSWMTFDGAHKFQAYLDASLYRFDLSQASNRLGSFSYNTLADLANGNPSTFSRTLSERAGSGQAWEGALALSDLWYASSRARTPVPTDGNGLTVQFGTRLEFNRFGERPAFNPLVDSLFARRTDHVPNTVTLAPMIGFTWNRGLATSRTGPVTFTETTNSFTGGIREYRGTLSPEEIDNVAQQTGLPSAVQQLQCVGSAVPSPNWARYTQSETAVPTQCADGTAGSPLVQTSPPVMLYAPNFDVTRSWRGELRWRWLISGQFSGNIGATYAVNLGQGGVYDLNFDPSPRFALSSEDNRPVYVTPASIATTSGAVAFTGSRLFPSFSRVSELRSDLRSDVGQLTAGLTWRYATSQFLSPAAPTPRRFNATVNGWYTYADIRSQTRGFSSTTADDPRQSTWGPGFGPRHTVQINVNAQLDRWFSITFTGRLSSGYQYTPRVASDINGDGFANDRAFVFDPTTASGSELASGMASLLSSAPREARACLRAQLSRIAGQNSCEGPWTAALGVVAITIDPFRIGLGNNGSMRIFVNNALGGLDQLLHGSRLQGWGQSALPDATLLNVRGFDANAKQFSYSVNPFFGSTSSTRNAYRPPFRVTVDFRFDIGRDRETQAIENFMRAAQATGDDRSVDVVKGRMLRTAGAFANDVPAILRMTDSLRLNRWQADSISTLGKRNAIVRDSIYGELARYLVSRNGAYDGAEPRQRWHNAIGAAIRTTYATGALVRAVLTDEQFAWLQAKGVGLSLQYSSDWLERIVRGTQGLPR